MNLVEFENRKLYFTTLENLVGGISIDSRYVLLISVETETEIKDITLYLKPVMNSNCIEVYCVGKMSEKLHDLIDEIVEEKELIEITTTWSSDESIEEICHYFFNLAGMKPSVLIAITNNDFILQKSLERYVSCIPNHLD